MCELVREAMKSKEAKEDGDGSGSEGEEGPPSPLVESTPPEATWASDQGGDDDADDVGCVLGIGDHVGIGAVGMPEGGPQNEYFAKGYVVCLAGGKGDKAKVMFKIFPNCRYNMCANDVGVHITQVIKKKGLLACMKNNSLPRDQKDLSELIMGDVEVLKSALKDRAFGKAITWPFQDRCVYLIKKVPTSSQKPRPMTPEEPPRKSSTRQKRPPQNKDV